MIGEIVAYRPVNNTRKEWTPRCHVTMTGVLYTVRGCICALSLHSLSACPKGRVVLREGLTAAGQMLRGDRHLLLYKGGNSARAPKGRSPEGHRARHSLPDHS